MPRIVIGEGALYTSGKGSGFPSCWSRGWRVCLVLGRLVPGFAKNFDVVTHDHRGIGQSDLTRSGFTVDRMAADVMG